MITLEQAKMMAKKADPKSDLVEDGCYEYENFYYLSTKPKGFKAEKKGDFYDSSMIKIDKNNGSYEFINFVELIIDDIADKLQKV